MKHIISTILCVMLLLSACAQAPSSSEETTVKTESTSTQTTGKPTETPTQTPGKPEDSQESPTEPTVKPDNSQEPSTETPPQSATTTKPKTDIPEQADWLDTTAALSKKQANEYTAWIAGVEVPYQFYGVVDFEAAMSAYQEIKEYSHSRGSLVRNGVLDTTALLAQVQKSTDSFLQSIQAQNMPHFPPNTSKQYSGSCAKALNIC